MNGLHQAVGSGHAPQVMNCFFFGGVRIHSGKFFVF
jgi:hypothetical protein